VPEPPGLARIVGQHATVAVAREEEPSIRELEASAYPAVALRVRAMHLRAHRGWCGQWTWNKIVAEEFVITGAQMLKAEHHTIT
jgi:hypothetical protein